jgi:hypothetical protein
LNLRSASEARAAWLNDQPSDRIQPDEYGMLTAAAYVMQHWSHDLHAFDCHADQIERYAAEFYGPGPQPRLQLLCAYLHRVRREEAPPCELSRSVLQMEYASGGLFALLSAKVNRARAAEVSAAVAAVASDACALTDYGREPPPDTPVFADRGYWAEFCTHGLRWGRETQDVALTARVITLAGCLRVSGEVPSLSDAVALLVEQQEVDGSFGPVDPQLPNPRRAAVLAVLDALALHQERE